MGNTTLRETFRLSAHEILLSECAAALLDETRVAGIDNALDAPNIDWSALIRTGLQQGLAQTTALMLRRFPNDSRIPPSMRTILERIYTATGARNRVMFRETARLTRALELAGISCLTLKGVGLALTAYPDPALRSFADIDLLVRPEDYDAAGEKAKECGYIPDTAHDIPEHVHRCYVLTVPEEILMGTLAPEIDPSYDTPAIRSVAYQVRVEIHRTLSHLGGKGAGGVDLVPFGEKRREVALPDGGSIRIPGPEPMLVHLAAHAYQHAHARLLFPLDIALVLQRSAEVIKADSKADVKEDSKEDSDEPVGEGIDWTRVLDLASRYEAQADLYLMLEYIRREWDTEQSTHGRGAALQIPDTVLEALNSGPGGRPEPLQTGQILHVAENTVQVWLRLLRGLNLQQRLLYVRMALFPTPAKMRRLFGERRLPLACCYLLRLSQLTMRVVQIGLRSSTHLLKVSIARIAR